MRGLFCKLEDALYVERPCTFKYTEFLHGAGIQRAVLETLFINTPMIKWDTLCQ